MSLPLESKLSDFVKNCTSYRSNFFEYIKLKQYKFLDTIPGLHLILFISAMTTIITVYSQIKKLTLFSMWVKIKNELVSK